MLELLQVAFVIRDGKGGFSLAEYLPPSAEVNDGVGFGIDEGEDGRGDRHADPAQGAEGAYPQFELVVWIGMADGEGQSGDRADDIAGVGLAERLLSAVLAAEFPVQDLVEFGLGQVEGPAFAAEAGKLGFEFFGEGVIVAAGAVGNKFFGCDHGREAPLGDGYSL